MSEESARSRGIGSGLKHRAQVDLLTCKTQKDQGRVLRKGDCGQASQSLAAVRVRLLLMRCRRRAICSNAALRESAVAQVEVRDAVRNSRADLGTFRWKEGTIDTGGVPAEMVGRKARLDISRR
jgi:hypothetical protein